MVSKKKNKAQESACIANRLGLGLPVEVMDMELQSTQKSERQALIQRVVICQHSVANQDILTICGFMTNEEIAKHAAYYEQRLSQGVRL